MALNYFPISCGLWQGAIVPLREAVVEEDFHGVFEAGRVFAAGRVDLVEEADGHPKTLLGFRAFDELFGDVHRVEDHPLTSPRDVREHLAAKTAADWLAAQIRPDPNYGDSRGWPPKVGIDYGNNIEATYIIRIYAEFEAGLRDYWRTFRKRDSRPKMFQLLNTAIPTEWFPQDTIDKADEVREYRNFLVHDIEDEPSEDIVAFAVNEAKKHLCAYIACLDPAWR